ncbi:hypothetical protein [Lacunimicrobium album]
MTNSNMIEYFYSDDDNEESSDSSSGTLQDVLATWERIWKASSGFFGFMSPGRVPVQVSWEESNEAELDIPIPERQGSMNKTILLSEFPEIIDQVMKGADPFELEGLEFEAWDDESEEDDDDEDEDDEDEDEWDDEDEFEDDE